MMYTVKKWTEGRAAKWTELLHMTNLYREVLYCERILRCFSQSPWKFNDFGHCILLFNRIHVARHIVILQSKIISFTIWIILL
jgi:hypothetical protein